MRVRGELTLRVRRELTRRVRGERRVRGTYAESAGPCVIFEAMTAEHVAGLGAVVILLLGYGYVALTVLLRLACAGHLKEESLR